MMLSLADIRRRLSARQPALLPPDACTRAAVALILRAGDAGPEVLFIERARRAGDPWSGDLGFPGGKVEAGDGGEREAAERETFEEIGLDLRQADRLGRLDDLAGAHLPIAVSCFVYAVRPGHLALSEEVVEVFWVPLAALLDQERHGEKTVRFRGETLTRPAIDLLGPGRPLLWGITYRLIRQFLEAVTASGNRSTSCPPHLFPCTGAGQGPE